MAKVLEDYLYYEEKDPDLKIYHGDCLDIMPLLPKVDLVVTDPPYGVNLGKVANNQRFDRVCYEGFEDTQQAVADKYVPSIRFALSLCNRLVMTPGVKNIFVYDKPDHVGAFYYPASSGVNKWGFSCWQPIFYYGKDPYAGKGSYADSFQSCEASEKNGHPCPKPIGQWKKLISRCSFEREIILDPFLGSGTTLVACKELNRNGIGIEINEKYCEIAKKRLKATCKPLFPLFREEPKPRKEDTELWTKQAEARESLGGGNG